MKRIIIAGGGTGGHLYPGIAVAREMQKRYKDIEILFVGTEN
ncbi:MAG: glycosyltransferase, partial [Nitrospirae bacterium]|nr:glycosyltransferase [Nitrospirota bacterium]